MNFLHAVQENCDLRALLIGVYEIKHLYVVSALSVKDIP